MPKNRKKTKKTSRKMKQIKGIGLTLLAALVLFSAVFISAKSAGDVAVSNITDGFRRVFSAQKTEGFPYLSDGMDVMEIRGIDRELFVMNSDGAHVLTAGGKQVGNLQFDGKNSRIAVCAGRALVYDTAKNKATLFSKTEKLGEVTADRPIVTASLCPCGAFAVATQGDSKASVLTVFNADFKKTFTWECAEERIADISLSSNGKKVALIALGVKNATVYSRLVVFGTDKTDPLCDVTYDDTMLLRVQFNQAGGLAVIGDNRTDIYSKKYQVKAKETYSEGNLCALSVDENGNTALCVLQNGGASASLVRFNAKGVQLAPVSLAAGADSLCVNGDNVLVQNATALTVYGKKGETLHTYTTATVPAKTALVSDCVFAVEENAVVKYK